PRRRPTRATLFPYTPLFRSRREAAQHPDVLVREPERLVRKAERGECTTCARAIDNDSGLTGPLQRDIDARLAVVEPDAQSVARLDRKSTRLNSSHVKISYAV